MRLLSLAVAVAFLVPIDGLSAQQPPPVEVGQRVRVTRECAEGYTRTFNDLRTICPTHTGAFMTMTAESIVLATGNGGNRLVFPFDSVTRLEVRQERRSWGWLGGIVGLFGGAGAGLGIGVMVGNAKNCYESECLDYWGRGLLAGAGAGLLLGVGIGSATSGDRWVEVPLSRLRVSFAPQHDGRFAFGVSVRF
jgi:hypothetical protein